MNRLNGDPTAATAEFYAAAAGKGMEETKKLWEHHANKYRVREEIYEEGGHFYPITYWQAQGFPIKDILEKSLPQNVQPCRMFGTIYRVPSMFVGKRWTDKHESGKRRTAVATDKLDEKPKDENLEDEKLGRKEAWQGGL